MKPVLLVVACLPLWLACGQPMDSELDGSETKLQWWLKIAPRCEGFPAKEHCDDGDTNLFNGLLCAVGVEDACDAVREGQGADGRWWRSPRRVDGQMGQEKTFSRDMAMGSFLYIVASRDQVAAQSWFEWMKSNRACSVEKPWGGGCLIRGPWRLCRDANNQSCWATPGIFGIYRRVYRYLGLDPEPIMEQSKDTDHSIVKVEASVNPLGYELHLKGVHVLLKRMMGEQRTLMAEVAAILKDRQGDNPFFRYLADGDTAKTRALLDTMCPKVGELPQRFYQWSWERDTKERAWEDSMIWDCIFMEILSRDGLL
ncbi:hypothetical protein [Pseudobacteriovorax antillogorgiicola]|uniref:Uncharacterized protein n=1 Tax=Pseudobacteriovorax antillogorgiicola TaxID=1513793 RepID=A0A1Y6C7U5_9BACT|nr:hypothetical protein [Pseudobacteriovorax antillogorgiicola]TCS51724.1 hypothetical protein EDD56_110109 [Pseudobacteriovorax antillogorgiicola]SMF49461.1 hypothetical protein SAMN06296036_11578 [Pseudobacteriovorax antillogorgiicola]